MTRVIILVLTLFFVCSENMNAQELSYGFRVGLNVSSLTGGETEIGESYSSNTGFHVGGGVRFEITDLFGIRGEVVFTQKGTKQTFEGNGPFIFRGANDKILTTGNKSVSLNIANAYLEIPIMVYGKQKLKAEQYVLKVFPEAIIARMPLMYGLPKNGFGFMSAWLRDLQEGKNIYCFTDEYRTATSGGDAAQGIFALLKNEASGVFHLGGPERMSRFDFSTKMALHFGLDKNLIIPSLQKDVKMPAKRPADVSLVSNKAFTYGFSPKKLEDNLKKLSSSF